MGDNIKTAHIFIAGMHVGIQIKKYETVSNAEYDALFMTPSPLRQILTVPEADGNSRKVFANGGIVQFEGQLEVFESLQVGVSGNLKPETLELAIECKSSEDYFSRFIHDNIALERLVRDCIEAFESAHPGNRISDVTVIPMMPQRILQFELAQFAADVIPAPEPIRRHDVHEVAGHTAQIPTQTPPKKLPVSRSRSRDARNSRRPIQNAIAAAAVATVGIFAVMTNESAPADDVQTSKTQQLSDTDTNLGFATSTTLAPATTIAETTTVVPVTEVPTTLAPVTEPAPTIPPTAPPTTLAKISAKQPANGRSIDPAQCTALAGDGSNKDAVRQSDLCSEFVKYKGVVDAEGNGRIFYSRDAGNHCVEAVVAVRNSLPESPGIFSSNGSTGKSVECR